MSSLRSIHLKLSYFANRLPKQRGQAAVEMALTLPILLLILFGIIVSVFTFYAYIQVSNAAREGARAGSLYRLTGTTSGLSFDQTVQAAIYDSSTGKSALGNLSPIPPNFYVSSVVPGYSGNKASPQTGDILTVTVTYSYTMPIVAAALPMFPQPLRIVRTVVMEVQ